MPPRRLNRRAYGRCHDVIGRLCFAAAKAATFETIFEKLGVSSAEDGIAVS